MTKYISQQEERRGTRRIMLAGAVAVIVPA